MNDNQEVDSSTSQILESQTAINQSLNKFTLGLKDGNKIQRKNALESMKKQLLDSFKAKKANVNTKTSCIIYTLDAIKTILRTSLTMWNDSMERCRELSCELVSLVLENLVDSECDNDITATVIMSLMQRLGGKEVKETSEEIRLQLLILCYNLIEMKSITNKQIFEVHYQEFVSILINSINDNYPEAKKRACLCAKLLANRLAGANFHMQSEALVKPLLSNITHQHSRVRKDIVECICDVIMYGNNKSVTEALPHLAQRLFDQAYTVRMAVIKLIGTWLLDLPDRYSFHSKLIPLMLTGFIDESTEIKELAEALWWDVGVKYEKENEEELKDKSNFLDNSSKNYPTDLLEKRPNLGCRELLRLNASKIVPGILNDIGDWVEATRIKSIQLLYIIIWQTEINITQHLETVLQTLFKASNENVEIIQTQVAKCAQLLGHFTDPQLSLNIAFKSIRKLSTINQGSIRILNGLLLGSEVKTPFLLVIDALRLLNEISLTLDFQLQMKIINCCETLLPLKKQAEQLDDNIVSTFEYLLFKIVYTVSALGNESPVIDLVKDTNEKLKQSGILQVYHVKSFLNELKANCDAWNDNSLEPIIFSKLIKEFGLSEDIISIVLSILKTSLNPSKDVQLKTRFLLLIPEIFVTASKNDETIPVLNKSNDTDYLLVSFEEIVNEMIIPNILWKAGRSAGAVRMSAIASLALLMHSDTVKNIQLKKSTVENLVKMMSSTLDDDNKSTRLYVCKIFFVLLSLYGSILEKDQLHKLYPEFIKRLDDQSEDIRFEILKVFWIYIEKLNSDYDKVLYQAHLQMIYENLLLYLDDSNSIIQLKVFELLKHSSSLDHECLLNELRKVKEKHRNTKYCDELEVYCKNLNII